MEKRILNAAKRSIYYRSARSIRISEFNALRINIIIINDEIKQRASKPRTHE